MLLIYLIQNKLVANNILQQSSRCCISILTIAWYKTICSHMNTIEQFFQSIFSRKTYMNLLPRKWRCNIQAFKWLERTNQLFEFFRFNSIDYVFCVFSCVQHQQCSSILNIATNDSKCFPIEKHCVDILLHFCFAWSCSAVSFIMSIKSVHFNYLLYSECYYGK